MPNVKRKLLGNTGNMIVGTSVVQPCTSGDGGRSNTVFGNWEDRDRLMQVGSGEVKHASGCWHLAYAIECQVVDGKWFGSTRIYSQSRG